jgi:hypothetical protein
MILLVAIEVVLPIIKEGEKQFKRLIEIVSHRCIYKERFDK